MTDRHSGYVVVLEADLREDDAQPTLDAIAQIKGVLSVTPVVGSQVLETVAQIRVRHQLTEKLWEALQ